MRRGACRACWSPCTPPREDKRPCARRLSSGVLSAGLARFGSWAQSIRAAADVLRVILLGGGLGVPRGREDRLHRLCFILVAVHDLAGQREHEVITIVAVGGQAVLRQLALQRTRFSYQRCAQSPCSKPRTAPYRLRTRLCPLNCVGYGSPPEPSERAQPRRRSIPGDACTRCDAHGHPLRPEAVQ